MLHQVPSFFLKHFRSALQSSVSVRCWHCHCPWMVLNVPTWVSRSSESAWRKASTESIDLQWIRVHLPMQGTQVWSLVWEDSTCHGATIYSAHHPRAQEQQPLSPCATANGGRVPQTCTPQQERPLRCKVPVLHPRVAPTRPTREDPHKAMKTQCGQKCK